MRKARSYGRWAPAAWLVSFAHVMAVQAFPASLAESVPRDSVAVYWTQEPDAAFKTGGLGDVSGAAKFLYDRAHSWGLLSQVDPSLRCWVDGLALLAEWSDFPHAFVLMKIDARLLASGGHELSDLEAAIVIRTRGDNLRLERRIQHLLTSYLNIDESELTCDSSSTGRGCVLHDRRLPAWATIQWGAIGDDYVLAIGPSAFSRVADAIRVPEERLAADPWFAKAFELSDVGSAPCAAYVNFDRLLHDVEPALAAKINRVREPVRLARVDRVLGTIGLDGPYVEIQAVFARDGRTDRTPLAGKRFLDGADASSVPPAAQQIAVIPCNPRAALRGLCDFYLASRSSANRERIRAYWQGVEAESGVSLENDLFSALGRCVLIHDDPLHPLSLSIARTIQIPLEGSSEAFRCRLDRFMTTLQTRLRPYAPLELHRATDGVWYLSLVLSGPAVAVTEGWLVLSYSPEAVRRNVEILAKPPSLMRAPIDATVHKDIP